MIKSLLAFRQRHQRGPLPMRLALVVLVLTVPWEMATAAPTHHPAAHKAAPANDVTAWIAKCQASESECAIGVSEARASFHVTQALFHDPDYCVAATDDDSHVLAPKVIAWFKDHPNHGSDPVYTGINASLAAMYPCKQ
ncbi:MAG: hypothetical protein ACJ8FT_02250 [Sphingomonas sp.]